MKITNLDNTLFFEKENIKIPKYNINTIRENTQKNPTWIHFGAGNIFRGFIAKIVDNLLNENVINTGIIAVDTHNTGTDDYEMIEKVYKDFDNLSLLASIKPSGEIDKQIIGSIAEVLHADFINYYEKLKKIFISNSLQIASFTITEKGYSIKDLNNNYKKMVTEDINNKPEKSKNIISIVTALLLERYKNGAYPITMLSMDNCANNGDKLKASILDIAIEWNKRGFVNNNFIEYIEDNKKVSFPLTMIDKITPRPSESISKELTNLGLEDMGIFKIANTNMAGFVNSEVSEYLVIEDSFANGRANIKGVYLTDRETVQKTEKMKVSACLNPLHTSLAIFGCLFNYNFIYEEMKDPILKKLVEKIGYDESLKVVANPKIINPIDFLREVIENRLTNPYIPDSPKRIAIDTSQKIPVRYGETIKAYMENELDISKLIGIPITIAAWLRYLMGIDDNGNNMLISEDPMLEELKIHIKKIKFKNIESVKYNLRHILSNKTIFLVDLYDKKINLGEKIEEYFKEMIIDKDAVRKCLEKYIK